MRRATVLGFCGACDHILVAVDVELENASSGSLHVAHLDAPLPVVKP